MRRLEKSILLGIRFFARHIRYHKIFYWTEKRLFGLRTVNAMPDGYYCFLYRLGMKLVDEKKFLGVADWMIHRIPYNVRCKLA